ncbi:MAG: hypothetical protein RBU29_04650, partial [bacterium]|nr:hypothetical protein [bacterium]
YPNRVDAGKRSTALVNNIDVTTTILHTSNVAPSKSMEGLNLQSDSKGRDIIFSGRTEMMARTKTHKLLLPNRPNLQSLYFDLAKDPHEKTNLYTEEKYKDDINQLKDALAAWQPDSYKKRNAYLDPDAPQIQQPNVPPRTPSYQEEIIQYFDKKMAAS